MFQDVTECSWMFRFQGFIDFHTKSKKKPDTLILLALTLHSIHKQNQQPLAKKIFSDRSTNKYYHSFKQTCTRSLLGRYRGKTKSRNKRDITRQYPTRLRRSLITALFVRWVNIFYYASLTLHFSESSLKFCQRRSVLIFCFAFWPKNCRSFRLCFFRFRFPPLL